MTSLRKRLEDGVAGAGKGAGDADPCCSLSVGDVRKVLELLDDAKVMSHAARAAFGVPGPGSVTANVEAAVAAFEE